MPLSVENRQRALTDAAPERTVSWYRYTLEADMSAIRERVGGAIAFLRATAAAVPQTSRSLRRAPGFVAIATLSLGAALGMSTSVFALIDSMRHPKSPFGQVDQLYLILLRVGITNPSRRDV